MQRIWATAATIWAVLGVTAALAWAQTSHQATVPAPSTAPLTSPAKGSTPAGTSASVAAAAPAHATTRTS